MMGEDRKESAWKVSAGKGQNAKEGKARESERLEQIYKRARGEKLPMRNNAPIAKIRFFLKWILILSTIYTLVYLHFTLPRPPAPKPLRTYNFSHPLPSQQLSELLISSDQHFDFPLSMFQQSSEPLHYKIQNVQEEVKEFQVDHRFILPKHGLIREPNLHILEHRKFTSCGAPTLLVYISWVFGFERCFSGAEMVTNPGNTRAWVSGGNKMTFYSDQLIRPFFISLRVPESKAHSKVYIFGFRVESNTIVAGKTISSYHLGTYELEGLEPEEDGRVYLACEKKECSLSYLYVMVMMDQLEVDEVGVYVEA